MQDLEKNLDEIIQSGVLIPSQKDVIAYLEKYPELTPIAVRACKGVKEHFCGENSQVNLLVYQDPEIIDDKYLFINVRVSDYSRPEFIYNLDELRERFLKELSPDSDGLMMISTDFGIISKEND